MFENKIINGVHATRYIASWIRSGGNLRHGNDVDNFSNWLKSLNLSDEDVRDIRNLATNGKMELEYSVKEYLNR